MIPLVLQFLEKQNNTFSLSCIEFYLLYDRDSVLIILWVWTRHKPAVVLSFLLK